MRNRRTILTVIVTAFLALCLPVLAAAQGTYDPYGRRDDRRDRDYGRDQDYGRDRNNGRYDQRSVRDSVRRLHDLSKNLQRDVDRVLDRSREDGTRHEDRLNDQAKSFRDAASNLKNRFNDGRDLYRSENEARRVLQLGDSLGRNLRHHFNDSRIYSDWSQINQELRLIANAYGFRYSSYDDGSYGRDDDYRRNDRNRRRDNTPWWERIRIP